MSSITMSILANTFSCLFALSNIIGLLAVAPTTAAAAAFQIRPSFVASVGTNTAGSIQQQLRPRKQQKGGASCICRYASVRSRSSTPSSPPVDAENVGRVGSTHELHPPPPSSLSSQEEALLESIQASSNEAKEWSDMFDLSDSEAAFYALFKGIRSTVPLGLKGHPFVLKQAQVVEALDFAKNDDVFRGWFTIDDLENAVNDDFLDADRGSTDNRKGWKVASVSEPTGKSFEDAKLTFADVQQALEQGTVIFNSAGAHICKLAGANLATVDATCLPCAINIYATAPDKRTSAPPHTDKQDVVVVQTSGRKHWKVYSPPDPARKPMADMFARGKHLDNLPLYAIESPDYGCQLLLETTLDPGDVLYIPAAFPHTTSTVAPASPVATSDNGSTATNDKNDDDDEAPTTSIHLTFGIDTHIWDLDYLSVRRFALRKGGVLDTALQQTKDEDNRYVGPANELEHDVRLDLFEALPFGLLQDDDEGKELLQEVVNKVQDISHRVDPTTAAAVDAQVWSDTAARVRQEGMELLEIHRDMCLAAMEEGRIREAEDAMTAHLTNDNEPSSNKNKPRKMSPERIARLSCFRVKDYFDKINDSMKAMLDWSHAGTSSSGAGGSSGTSSLLPDDWAFTLPIKVGDQVEADLGGAFFPATVTRVSSTSKYDVQFFDGDSEGGLDRSQIKLTNPPEQDDDNAAVDTSNMTAKQLKRWKKQQTKKKKTT